MQILDISPRWVAVTLLAALALPATAAADKVWRCGNEYTNQPGDAKARGCKPVEGGNLTVIEGLKPQGGSRAPAHVARSGAPAARADSERVESAEQRARDTDARAILEAELRKAEARQVELRQEYQAGEPEKRPEELRHPALHQQRAAALKEQLARADADVAALRRELARMAPPSDKR
ncbi:MAG: hypothetical protein RLZZ22_1715 [Pseudomonadota bacterium]|jgi:ATP/maltotriose-dependent transcriptional regulator MalT